MFSYRTSQDSFKHCLNTANSHCLFLYILNKNTVSLNIFYFLNPIQWNGIGKVLVAWEEQE